MLVLCPTIWDEGTPILLCCRPSTSPWKDKKKLEKGDVRCKIVDHSLGARRARVTDMLSKHQHKENEKPPGLLKRRVQRAQIPFHVSPIICLENAPQYHAHTDRYRKTMWKPANNRPSCGTGKGASGNRDGARNTSHLIHYRTWNTPDYAEQSGFPLSAGCHYCCFQIHHLDTLDTVER